MKWILVLLVLIGDWMIIEKIREGFYMWLFVDGFFGFYNMFYKDFVQSAIFFLYAIMGLYGLHVWN